MKRRFLQLEILESRFALNGSAGDDATSGTPAGTPPDALAESTPCDLECERATVLTVLAVESQKKDASLVDLTERLSQAGGDIVERARLQLWIDGWNQYGETINADTDIVSDATTPAEIEAVAARYALVETGLLPLTDLRGETHLGYAGGLYPSESNVRPPQTETDALTLAQQILPRDTFGQADPNGRIVMVSIGMSNTNQEFGVFISRANADAQKNSRLSIINGAQGGQDAADWVDPNAPTWAAVDQRLAQAGLTPQQVQVVWLKQAQAGPAALGDSATNIVLLKDKLEAIARNLTIHYPNVKLAYVSSRTRAYVLGPQGLNPEPFAYESGFSAQQLIADQIAGAADLNYDPARGPVVAPLLLWGPYIWADGTKARSDGFAWLPHDVRASDMTHPETSGREKVAYELLSFMHNDATARPWYLASNSSPVNADLNRDGRVGLADLAILQMFFGRTGIQTAGRGDIDGDQRIARHDAILMLSQWGRETNAPQSLVAQSITPSPSRRAQHLRASRVRRPLAADVASVEIDTLAAGSASDPRATRQASRLVIRRSGIRNE